MTRHGPVIDPALQQQTQAHVPDPRMGGMASAPLLGRCGLPLKRGNTRRQKRTRRKRARRKRARRKRTRRRKIYRRRRRLRCGHLRRRRMRRCDPRWRRRCRGDGAAAFAETACVAYGGAASKTKEASRDDDVNGSTPNLGISWRWETTASALQAKPRVHGRCERQVALAPSRGRQHREQRFFFIGKAILLPKNVGAQWSLNCADSTRKVRGDP